MATEDQKGGVWASQDLDEAIRQSYESAGILNDWYKERDVVREALRVIGSILPSSRYKPVGVLGVGGTGIVLHLTDSLFPSVENALKFPRPIPGLAQAIAEMVAKELAFLADLRYRGIVRMVYYRIVPDFIAYGAFPFYLMEAVTGLSSKTYLKEAGTQESFLRVMLESAKTVQYLHNFPGGPYVHLDIKPQNIVVTGEGAPILIDLGTCKKLSRGHDRTVLACTQDFAHPGLTRLLVSDTASGHKRLGQIDRSEIDPVWDLWSYARTVLAWMGVRYDDGTLEHAALAERLDAYTRKFLFLLCARLLTDFQPHWLLEKVGVDEAFVKSIPIRSADQLVAQIGKLLGTYNPLARVPELSLATTGSIQAAPGVHVKNTERLTQTLEHRLFRRLNGITQLGIVSQIFPGAKHTRREHSLGTYGNVCRMLKALYADPTSPFFRQIVEEQDVHDILLASLLHDLGQFPMAHDLEDVDEKVFDHEDLTQAMLKGIWKTGRRGSKSIRFESMEPVFRAWNTTPERIIELLSAKARSSSASQKDKLLRSIISGPLDADKLDYLFRDARYTDVPYPNGIDVDRLFRSLTTVIVPRIPGGTSNVPAIGVHAKGKIAAEFMTMARYAMFSQVYWHHAVRAQKAMLARAVAALLATLNPAKSEEFRALFVEMVCELPESMYRHSVPTQLDLPTEPSLTAPKSNVGAGTDLVASDAAVLTWLRDRMIGAGLQEAELIQGILTRNLFKRLWVVGRDAASSTDWDEMCELWEKMSARQKERASHGLEQKIRARLVGANQAQDVTLMKAVDAKSLASQLTDARTPWLLVDMPGAKSGSDVGLHYVTEVQARRMRKDDRAMGTLEPSSAWKHYAEGLRSVAGNVRVFCDGRLVETLDASVTQVAGFEDLLAAVQAESAASN